MARVETAAVLLLGGSLLLTGCPSPNTYATPRTTPQGKVSHSVAAESFGFVADVTDPATGETERVNVTLPTLPTYTIRVGLTDELDIGGRVANLSSLAVDLKYNFLKTEAFDMAIDPGAQWLRVGVNIYHLHAPLLLGFNFGEVVSLVLSPGVTYSLVTESLSDQTLDEDESYVSDGLFLRFGVGLNIRLMDNFALHPEITAMRLVGDETNTLIYQAGFGFNFGTLPSFGASSPEPL